MRKGRKWVVAYEDAPSLLRQIEERVQSSDIEVQHRDVLIRLRSLIEEDVAKASKGDDREAQPRTATARNPGS